MSLKLKVVCDTDTEKVWTSKEINHGDWPFRFMVKLEYVEGWGDEAVEQYGKYHVSLCVLSVEAAKETDAYQSALDSCEWTAEQVKEWGSLAEYQMLLDYGTAAHLWQGHGNNLKALMGQCRKQLQMDNFMFGFAMDRAENAIGTTGWDMVKGNVLGGLRA